MSLNINEKLASGETLTDEEVAYARDHAIVLPEEYGDPVSTTLDSGATPDPVVQTGPAFEQPPSAGPVLGPGIFLTVDQLESLTKKELVSVAEAAEFEVPASATKADIVQSIAYGGAPEGSLGDATDADDADDADGGDADDDEGDGGEGDDG